MEDTLVKIKNNLQGINSRVDESKNLINNLDYKEEKKHLVRTARGKKNQKLRIL